MNDGLLSLFAARKGHFRFESGHHGDLWLDLELLCQRPESVRPFASELARRLAPWRVDAVCGPLVEGAFVALMVASELKVNFLYSDRIVPANAGGMFSIDYRIPAPLREGVRGRRVAIVNDVINAGSAVRGTFSDLKAAGAEPVVIGTLLTLGSPASEYAAESCVALESLTSLPNNLWVPGECPLCAAGVALTAGDG
jgi:orotate phosphoribosyltransferase